MKHLFLLIPLFFSLSCTVQTDTSLIQLNNISINNTEIVSKQISDSIISRIHKKKQEALDYCKNNHLNTNICFLLDMRIHSGKKRFFVYDFKKDTIINSALVSHGCGLNNWASDQSQTEPIFSNVPESHLSSLGKYRVGDRGWSNWGIHVKYLLDGLENTNNNALKRYIVLHGWNRVTDEEIYPNGTVESWGCPAVSNQFMTYLDSILKKQKQSVLLWMYY